LDGIKGVAAEAARDVVAKLSGLLPDASAVEQAVATALKQAR